MKPPLEQYPLSDPDRPAIPGPPCSLLRRLGALVYDAALLAGVVFIAWLPMPAVSSLLAPILPPAAARGVRLAYLLALCFLFFAWSWTHGGQTLGMKIWRIRLIPLHAPPGAAVSWRSCWLRFIAAIASWGLLGMGFLWSLAHPRKLT